MAFGRNSLNLRGILVHTMSAAMVQQSVPLIPNANQYLLVHQYVSVHSEDRDVLKYPNPAKFSFEMPQPYERVVSARLHSWSFPTTVPVFSLFNKNVRMGLQIVDPYDPAAHGGGSATDQGIHDVLVGAPVFFIDIEAGNYTPQQMATELTNKLNAATTLWISNAFSADLGTYAAALAGFTAYDRFAVEYSAVGRKMWFGNTADRFVVANESIAEEFECGSKRGGTSDWGLPSKLGFNRCNELATSVSLGGGGASAGPSGPLFYYRAVNGDWLVATLPGATAWFVEPPRDVDLNGPDALYLEVDPLNCIDETSAWTLSQHTAQTSGTNGAVRSSFAKLPLPVGGAAQSFDVRLAPYKYFSPPAERLRRLNVSLRYHSGELVPLGSAKYSFMIEFTMLAPQADRIYTIHSGSSLATLNPRP